MTHWSCAVVASSSRDSVGMVTLRLELPTNTMSRLRHSTARVHQRRAWTRGSEASVVSGAVMTSRS